MAVDSRQKRSSCLNVGLPFGRMMPPADSVVDAYDRRQGCFLYAGIAAAALTVSALKRVRQFLAGPSRLMNR